MKYTSHYTSPFGDILLAADDEGLTGLWFEGHRYYGDHLDPSHQDLETPAIQEAKNWLDTYFSGQNPKTTPPLHIIGSDFQKEICDIMLQIPFGQVRTYGDIAQEIAKKRGIKQMSSRAVGGAVGHNPVSIIVPCHRVVGANGNLTGYGGGIDRKIKLLTLEGVDMSQFYVPKHGSAL